ncbi:similar to exo-beta-1,3-glucanase [Plenodomus lingam JN3]|uniref:Similar to exo-beta-1,3-glucanase n=2 Tax=Leptosphaeria maculans TaxID=5022 RepID=E4ZGW2_LEPMJ|nr:similar to exo-beta-1,3-glucanase [Plenodomus lingam JN3]CBX90532.1 similar to exo-beta-1,3-glucanase [Plenodomus lingam JN3]
MMIPSANLLLAFSTCTLALHVRSDTWNVDPHELNVNTGDPAYTLRPTHPHGVTDLTGPHVKPDSKNGSSDSCAPYWLENVKHQGIASFNPNPDNYTVFRNVKDYGAVGDGITDDTAAINRAMAEQDRCGPGVCESATTSPAIVYFPSGTYLISSSIIDYYYTQIIGNPNCLPTIVAAPHFEGASFGLIDGSKYPSSGPRAGRTGFPSTRTFFRQIRNLILDMTKLPLNTTTAGIHWPTAQATSLQNIVFNMNPSNGMAGHQAIVITEGSGGFMTDLVFNGGHYGLNVGNQQYTTRNLTFNNVHTAINQLWNWGWNYKSISINNCNVGLNITANGPDAINVGSITLLDSEISNTPIGIVTSKTDSSLPAAGASLYMENIVLNNVETAILGPNSTYLAGSSGQSVISAWADGHRYLPNGPNAQRAPIEPSKRPAELLDANGKFYERSRPQYGEVPLSQFMSARDAGARGDGTTDDTKALNAAILKAKYEGKILFIDAGYYKVTGTIYVPPGSKIVGEALSAVILSAGDYFNDMENPKAVVQIAQPGEQGRVELSDLFVSTQGQQKGAILIEYNLASYDEPSGLWDVHARIGGFAGSDLQKEQCIKTSETEITAENLAEHCIAAFMAMHVTKSGTGLYLENNWLWTADHDLDDVENNNGTQVSIYSGRGLHIESERGVLWLYGTVVEHHIKYQYQFVDTHNIIMGHIQTETAYFQPNPDALIPFPTVPSLNDPVFTPSSNTSVNAASGWGLRILRSNNILGYGLGLYSFFDNYNSSCSVINGGADCQTRMVSIEGDRLSYDIGLYNLNTLGTTQMVTRDGVDLASNEDNNSTYTDTINVFRIGSAGL